MSAVILALLPAPHSGIEDLVARAGAVVAGEYKDRVLGQSLVLEECPQTAHVVVNVGDHSKEVPNVGAKPLHVASGELRRRMHGPVRGVRRNEGQKRLVRCPLRLDEATSVVKPNIRAIALDRLRHGVVEVGSVEVGVVPVVGSLAHASAAVAHYLAEAAVFRPEGVVVSQVPLAEHAGGVAGILEDLAHRDLTFRQEGASAARVPDPGTVGPATCDQCGAGWRAGWGHMKVDQADGLVVEPVEVRRPQHRVAVAAQITVTLIVGNDQHDVGALVSGHGAARPRSSSNQEQREGTERAACLGRHRVARMCAPSREAI